MIFGSVLNVILNIALASQFIAKGTALSVIITESFILVGLYLIVRKGKSMIS